ncbi:MAG: hypothetical protein WDM96_08360 [Lacunisphaera sp.]
MPSLLIRNVRIVEPGSQIWRGEVMVRNGRIVTVNPRWPHDVGRRSGGGRLGPAAHARPDRRPHARDHAQPV